MLRSLAASVHARSEAAPSTPPRPKRRKEKSPPKEPPIPVPAGAVEVVDVKRDRDMGELRMRRHDKELRELLQHPPGRPP